MNHILLVTVALLLGGSISFVLAGYAGLRLRESRDASTTAAFVGVVLAAGIWASAYGHQLHVVSRGGTTFWSRVAFVGALLMALAWPLFVLYYTRRETAGRWSIPAALAIVPGVTLLALLTNDVHHLLFTSVELVTVDGATLNEPVLGSLGWVNLVYSYGIYLSALCLLGAEAVGTSGQRRRQSAILLVAGVIPLAVSTAGIFGLLGETPIDYTPAAFAVTAPLVGWGLFRHRLLDLVPVAYQQIFAEMDDGLVVLDADDRIVHVNATGERILDASARNAVGVPIDEFVAAHPAADLAALLDRGTDAAETEIVLTDEEDVSIFDVQLSSLGTTGDGAGTILVFRNVTDKRTAQRRFQALVENTSNLVTVLDVEGSATYVSPKMEELLGYSPTELVGEDLFELVHPDDRDATLAELERCIEVGHARAEYRIQHEDGSWRRFESVAESFFDDPALDGIVVTSWDVTAQRTYEQRLQVQNRVLRHDLRNDVNVVHGNAGLLLDDLAGTEYADRIRTILRKAEDLDDLGERARSIDRVLHGDPGTADADLVDLLTARLDRAASEYPRATFEAVLEGGPSAAVRPQVESVFDDLLENAVVHNDRDEPRVQVWTSAHELNGIEYVNVHVADDGPGIGRMTRKVLESEVETQLEHSPGLGLWLARWIVESSDGSLDISRVQPRGTVVSVSFPRTELPVAGAGSRIPALDD